MLVDKKFAPEFVPHSLSHTHRDIHTTTTTTKTFTSTPFPIAEYKYTTRDKECSVLKNI